jgi:cytochrome c-type biogenesis protein CcmF
MRYEGAIGDYALKNGQIQKIVLGATLGVYRDGKRLETIHPTREYFPSMDVSLGPVSRYFLGEAATEVALDAGATRDLWVAMQPDGDALADALAALDKQLAGTKAPFAAGGELALRLALLYKQRPSPATFQVIVSPLVTWIWIGSVLMALGALLAMWPTPDLQTRRVTARQRARVARDLGARRPEPVADVARTQEQGS